MTVWWESFLIFTERSLTLGWLYDLWSLLITASPLICLIRQLVAVVGRWVLFADVSCCNILNNSRLRCSETSQCSSDIELQNLVRRVLAPRSPTSSVTSVSSQCEKGADREDSDGCWCTIIISDSVSQSFLWCHRVLVEVHDSPDSVVSKRFWWRSVCVWDRCPAASGFLQNRRVLTRLYIWGGVGVCIMLSVDSTHVSSPLWWNTWIHRLSFDPRAFWNTSDV